MVRFVFLKNLHDCNVEMDFKVVRAINAMQLVIIVIVQDRTVIVLVLGLQK